MLSPAIIRPKKPLAAYGYLAPVAGETLWCHGCSKQKPMAKRASYCLDCATARKEIDDARLMPDPPFQGQASSYTIGHIIESYRLKGAPDLDRAPDHERRTLDADERWLGWFVLPPFQRPPVWTLEQQVRLIESLWLELPIGVYIYNQTLENGGTDSWLIDGQQRIGALLAYVNDAFPVFGYRYSQLGEIERRGFENHVFPAIQLNIKDRATLEDIYYRLAYGGTAHEPKPTEGVSK